MCDETELIWQLITPLKKMTGRSWMPEAFLFYLFCSVRCVRPCIWPTELISQQPMLDS